MSRRAGSRSRRRARARRGKAVVAVGLACLAIGGGALALGAGLGSSRHPASGCAIVDLSESTEDARSAYLAAFERFATAIGNEGSGKLCLILAAADPIAEGTPAFAEVGPESDDRGTPKAAGEIEARVRRATAQLAGLLAHPPVRQAGSALVEAAVVAGEVLGPGDRLLFLSDGLQWSRAGGHLQREDLTPAAISRRLDRLGGEGLLADLHGVTVTMPFFLYHPGGLGGGAVHEAQLRSFWGAWGKRSGAELMLGGRFG